MSQPLKHAIFLDKPKWMSSRRADKEVEIRLGAKKSGDTGTLDDNTVGFLLVCLDEATKAMILLNKLDKEYITTIALHKPITKEKLKEALRYFTGDVRQLPPLRSAVARIERVRKVYSLEILNFSEREIELKVKCQAGFYVRKFAHDLGKHLGCGAHMKDLRRTAIGNVRDAECVKLEDVKRTKLIRIEDVLRRMHVKKVFVKENALKNVIHGIGLMSYHLDGMDENVKEGDLVAVFYKNDVVAVGKVTKGYDHYKSHLRSEKAYQYVMPDRVFKF